MTSSSSENYSDDNSSSGEGDFPEIGLVAYQYEPEYTKEELEHMNAIRNARQKEIDENPRKNNTSWCSCAKCVSMPMMSECLCCHEFELFEEYLQPGECITSNEDFLMVCLNLVVLATAFVSFLRYKRYRGRAPDVLTNRQNRLMAYRQFVCWVRKGQPLGKKNRVPLPSCVVNRIRTEFSASNEEYEGFHFYTSDLSDSDSDSD